MNELMRNLEHTPEIQKDTSDLSKAFNKMLEQGRKTVSEVSEVKHLSTINEQHKGEEYPPGSGVNYIKRTFRLNGETVEGVFPKFEDKMTLRLPKGKWMGSDESQMKYCTYLLSRRCENDPEFASQFSRRQLEQIKNCEPRISGLTWHHNEIPGVMQLVDSSQHTQCRHTGGRSLWGGGQYSR